MATMATCHPDKRHSARGLCHACYRRWWLDQHPDRKVAAETRTAAWRSSEAGRQWAKSKWRARTAEQVRRDRGGILRRKYGITFDDLERMLDGQNGACAICLKPLALAGEKPDFPHVDHCHVTSRVRGLLCMKCNVSLGQLGDTPAAISRVLEYLKGAA